VTIFIDHYCRLGFIYLQQQLTSKEAVHTKKAFECFASTPGENVLHYHMDNGRFANKTFCQTISKKRQTIFFCGIKSHRQNGVAEQRMRELQENSNTMLLHAQHQWQDAIDKHLWSCELCMANDIHNNNSPLEKFSGTNSSPIPSTFSSCQLSYLCNRWDNKTRAKD
jgi:hypothetical protein